MAKRRAVVIGAGITGVLTARELLLAGWDVVVVEGSHVGAGSSSRTAAGIRQQFSTPGTVRGMQYCVRFYREFANEVEGGQSPIVQNGYLFLHDQPDRWAEAQRIAAMQRAQGLEVEVYATGELERRFPWLAPGQVGGTFCPTDGFLLPHLVYNEGARRVVELGGRLMQKAPVLGAEVSGDRITGLKTGKGLIEGDVFFDCTNAWTRRLSAAVGGEALDVEPLKRYLWFLARGEGMPASTLASMPLVVAPSGAYCRPENSDALLLGKKHEVAPEWSFSHEDQDHVDAAYHHDGGVDAHPYEVWAELAAIIPAIGDLDGFHATTGGYYGTTPDHNPFLGYDRQRSNLIHLVGFSGHGAMMAPFTARVGAALADAGRDLDQIAIDGAAVGLEDFRVGRPYRHAEAMVI